MSARPLRARAVPAVLLAAGLVLAAPLTADAHVRVTPDQAAPGSYATLTFRVPTESATASTVRVEVDLPTDTPFTSVAYQPVPGWTAKVVTSTLDAPVTTAAGATITQAPTKVVWTADDGHGIAPGQFQQFTISAGAVPDTGSVLLPAVQTYSDGSVVRWSEATPASGEEPEHPAPMLYVRDAPPAADAPAGATAGTSTAGSAGSTGSDGLAVGLGVAGLVLGAAGLGTGVVALRRTRS